MGSLKEDQVFPNKSAFYEASQRSEVQPSAPLLAPWSPTSEPFQASPQACWSELHTVASSWNPHPSQADSACRQPGGSPADSSMASLLYSWFHALLQEVLDPPPWAGASGELPTRPRTGVAAESPAGKAGRTGTHSGHRKSKSDPKPACPVFLCLEGDKLLTGKRSLQTTFGLLQSVVCGPLTPSDVPTALPSPHHRPNTQQMLTVYFLDV
jgi:hypothetical protein